MKTSVPLLLFLASGSLLAQTGNAYGLKLHVTSTRVDKDCIVITGSESCNPTQVLHALVEGRLFELRRTTTLSKGLVPLGDYQARLTEEKRKPTSEFTRQYSIQFPDGSTQVFDVIGEMELPRP